MTKATVIGKGHLTRFWSFWLAVSFLDKLHCWILLCQPHSEQAAGKFTSMNLDGSLSIVVAVA